MMLEYALKNKMNQMSQIYYNNGLKSNMLYPIYNNINQNTQYYQQFQSLQMNFQFNQFQLYNNILNNNYQNVLVSNPDMTWGKNKNKFSKFSSGKNELISNKYYYRPKKQKKNKYVLDQYKKEVLTQEKENNSSVKNERKSSIDSLTTNPSDINNNNSKIETEKNEKLKFNIDNQKETLNLKNNNEEKKEDDDSFYINEDNIPNNRRFSQKSKRSDDSDNSNNSISTSYTSYELTETKENLIKKDVSLHNNLNIEKNEEKTECNDTHKCNPIFENTEILNVKVKISKNNTAIFKLKRYDDIFMTIQYFCEINNLDEKYIKPLIIKSLCAINTIYQVMNSKIDEKNISTLKEVKNNDILALLSNSCFIVFFYSFHFGVNLINLGGF